MNEEVLQRLEREAERITLSMPASLDDTEFTKVFNLEFARLLVRECVEVCCSVAAVREGYNDADGRDTAYSCGDQIKEYFGVEP